ncbi:ATP-binding protein [Elioraea sp.]|uniref:ATP-binding protein n=1 Tax=Elioraea sp. TaxID=2185103 RepID=UPI0025BC6E1E|nr:ATP-binding protein [Elioraea sp.]
MLLLGGLMLLHVGSMWVHERALRDTEQGARLERMADQLAAARAAVASLPEAARDAAAHAISRPGLEIHWDRMAPMPAAAPPEPLATAAARLGPGARIGWDPKAEPGHRVLGALPAEDGGWIVFSAPWLAAGGGPLDHGAIASMVAMALGIALVSILVVRWITRPLRRLAAAADRIGRDPSPRPVPLDGPEEVRHAAAAFNAMQQRIGRLLEDRTETLAAMSHDLRTPLSRLQLRVAFLPEGEDRVRLEADIAEMETMITRTLDYIREGRDAEPVRPADLAAILQTLASDAADRGHDVDYVGPGRAVLPLRRVAAKRAVSNLLDNALRHGVPPVRLRIQEDGDMLVVEVSDSGAGIAEADRDRAVAPFVQLDTARGGSGVGLGLAIAQRFAQGSNGRLELRDAPGGGLLARILLPRQAG